MRAWWRPVWCAGSWVNAGGRAKAPARPDPDSTSGREQCWIRFFESRREARLNKQAASRAAPKGCVLRGTRGALIGQGVTGNALSATVGKAVLGVWGKGGGRRAREKESEGRSAWDYGLREHAAGTARSVARRDPDSIGQSPFDHATNTKTTHTQRRLANACVAAFDRFAIRWRAKRLGPFRSISDSGRETRACLRAVSSSNCPFDLGPPYRMTHK